MHQKALSRALATHKNHRITRKVANITSFYKVIVLLSLCLGSAGASETAVYIDSCQTTISQPGTYLLRSDLSRSETGGFCISIVADNVTLDGDGHSVTGPYHAAGTGILVHNPSSVVSNIKLKNLTVSRWGQAILLKNVVGGEIVNNTLSDNGLYVGIFLEDTIETSIKDNILEKNHRAIYLLNSSANIISNNSLVANPLGIQNNYASNGNLLVKNVISESSYAIEVHDSDSVTVADNHVDSTRFQGLRLLDTVDSIISSNTIQNSGRTGLLVAQTTSSTVISNRIIGSGDFGIDIADSQDNLFANNHLSNAVNVGFFDRTEGLYPNKWSTDLGPGTNIVGGLWLGGNFWANPEGTGFSETCWDFNYDGICDEFHVLQTTEHPQDPLVNIDYLPLAPPPASGPDGDDDGVPDVRDQCLDENPMGRDADKDGCVDTPFGLIELISTLPDGTLSDAIRFSLSTQVQNAQQSLEDSHIRATVAQLNALIREIEALSGNQITAAAAVLLTGYTLNLIVPLL